MQHLFIITYGRSGSTALQNVLNSLPGYCIRGENGGAVASLYLATELVRDRLVGRESTSRDDPWYGIEGIDLDGMERRIADIVSKEMIQPPPGTRVAGFKEIRHDARFFNGDAKFARYCDFLLRRFVDTRIIFLTRDAEAVARSGMWQDLPLARTLDLVRQCDQRFAREHARLGHASFLIDHSQFDGIADGLRPLIEWLGEDFTSELANETKVRLNHMQNYSATSFHYRMVRRWNEFSRHFKR